MTGEMAAVAEQRLLPTARLVAWAALLALPAEGLDAYVAGQVARNPALDLPAGRTCPRCGGTVWRAGAHACLSRRTAAGPESATAREAYDALLASLPLTDPDRQIARYLLADVDRRGRLDRPLADVARDLGVAEPEVVRVLDTVRTVAPPGFGARDLRESLLLQLDAWPDAPPLCRVVVEHHLDELDGLTGDLRAALHWIAANLDAGSAPYDDAEPALTSPPDLVVDGALTVHLADAPWLALRVAPAYERLAPRDRAVADARGVVSRLHTRAAALLRVAQETVDRQAGWIRGGARTAVTRADVAATVGLHESTVSRAVAGKRMLLPDARVVALADLFGPRGRSARECLRDLVAAETTPLSDAALAAALTAQGHPSARRTVAKYRAELGIPRTDVRRRTR